MEGIAKMGDYNGYPERKTHRLLLKLTNSMDTAIRAYANRNTGADENDAVNRLLSIALEKVEAERESGNVSPEEQASLRLLALSKANSTRRMLTDLAHAVHMGKQDDKEFSHLCTINGENPPEILDLASSEQLLQKESAKRTQRDNLGWLLRGLLDTCGDNGMQAKEIFKITARHGFSTAQVRRSLTEIGAVQFYQGKNDSRYRMVQSN